MFTANRSSLGVSSSPRLASVALHTRALKTTARRAESEGGRQGPFLLFLSAILLPWIFGSHQLASLLTVPPQMDGRCDGFLQVLFLAFGKVPARHSLNLRKPLHIRAALHRAATCNSRPPIYIALDVLRIYVHRPRFTGVIKGST